MLKLENISTGYGKKQVLYDVSLEVSLGEIVLLVGSNGSGKSTLLKTIYNLLPLWNKGSVSFDGEYITGLLPSNLLKKGLLYIQQKNNLFEELTVKENLEMAGLILPNKSRFERIESTLTMFPILSPHLKRTPMKLSGGERQLLALAMALLHNPKMIILDEPLSGLSQQNINLVTEYLTRINSQSNTTLLIVEHRVKECVKIANKIIGLKLGRVVCELESGPTFDINKLNHLFI